MTRRIFCKILLVVVAILGLFVLSGVLSAQGNRDTAFERVRAVQAEHTDRLMAINGVEGTAIGLDRNDRPTLKVFTARPGVAGIPKMLDGVAVQVVVTGKIYALSATGWYERPVPIGVSTGHPDITAGTIGCRVTDGEGNIYALSNNHVYANSNNATIGDNVLQPGTYDGGVDPVDAIGTLADFEPIVFHPRANNTIDAAIATVIKDDSIPRVGTATPEDGYGTPSSTTVEATLSMAVQKYGRTTGLTTGQVTGINATVRVRYSSGSARFVGQIIIESTEEDEFSAGGDSGSLIVTLESNNPVGLLFAGNSTVTIANPIDLVLERFGVTVDDSEGPPPETDVHDVAVTAITAPSWVLQGDPVSVDVDVANEGTYAETFDVVLTDDTATIGTKSVSLAAGASTTVSFSWDTTGSSIDDHTLTATAGPVSEETDTTDNSLTTVVTVELAVTDIAITAVDALSSVVQGDVVSVEVTVENVGNQDVTSSINVTLASDLDATIGTHSISGLAAGASETLTFTWDTSTASQGEHNLTASHDFSDGGDAANDSKSTTVTVTEPGGETDIYVADIDMSIKTAGINVNAIATVTVVDADGAPVAGATVSGSWSGATSDSDVGTTDTLGEITLQSNKIKNAESGTTFTFTVDNVVKSGWEWDKVGASNSITVP